MRPNIKSLHLWLYVASYVCSALAYVEQPWIAPYSKALLTVAVGLLSIARWDKVGKAPKELA